MKGLILDDCEPFLLSKEKHLYSINFEVLSLGFCFMEPNKVRLVLNIKFDFEKIGTN